MCATKLVDLSPPELLRYLPQYKIVVCAICEYAVQPLAVERHLKDIHDILRAQRKPFKQYIESLDLDDPDVVVARDVEAFPVPLLPVLQGLRCNAADCLYLCASEKRMKNHWSTMHCRSAQPHSDWGAVRLQTFFRGNLLKYFTDARANVGNPHTLDQSGEEQDLPLDDRDSALLDHFVDYTSISLAHDMESRTLWPLKVPSLARQSSFLMHGLLACSALHLAHKNPGDNVYSITAALHQDAAMPAFRHAISYVDEENCHAVLVFSHLLVILCLAVEKQDQQLFLVNVRTLQFLPTWCVCHAPFPSLADKLVNRLHSLRDGCSMVRGVWDVIIEGPVGQLAEQWQVHVENRQSSHSPLKERLLSVMPLQGSLNAWSAADCNIYVDAAVTLARVFDLLILVADKLSAWDAVRMWPMLVSHDFMQFLDDGHPGALILLAHYCIFLKRFESYWYLEGRAAKIMSVIVRHLDPEWLSCIEWPLDILRQEV